MSATKSDNSINESSKKLIPSNIYEIFSKSEWLVASDRDDAIAKKFQEDNNNGDLFNKFFNMAFFRNLHCTRILMLVSLKIIMSVLICKFFLETASAHQGSAPASTGKQSDDNVVVGSRIREASLRGSGSTFGWYGNTRTVFMNKVGGVPRWIML